MIGSGLKKLAKTHGMHIGNGVAYGNMLGYATTLSEGAGWKRVDIAASVSEAQRVKLQTALADGDLQKNYRIQSFGVGGKWICITFLDNPGTMKKLEAFIDWFYPMLGETGIPGGNICPECGMETTEDGWYLINGIAYPLHQGCYQRVAEEMQTEDQQRAEEDTGSYVQGFVGAAVGAALGSVVWALVLSLGYVASIVGFVIGWLAEKGYNLLHGKQGKGKTAILVITVLLGVLLGTIIPDCVVLGQMIHSGELPGYSFGDIPPLLVMLLTEDSEYLSATLGNMGMGALFALLGTFGLFKRTKDEVSGNTIKKLQ